MSTVEIKNEYVGIYWVVWKIMAPFFIDKFIMAFQMS